MDTIAAIAVAAGFGFVVLGGLPAILTRRPGRPPHNRRGRKR